MNSIRTRARKDFARIYNGELAFLWMAALILLMPQACRGQDEDEASTQDEASAQLAPSTIDTTAVAGDADAEAPRRRLVKWNEYDGPISSLRVGFGGLLDFATYDQDSDSKEQVDMTPPDVGVRDFRVMLNGRFKTERPFTWTLAYMWDAADKEWRFRLTGFQVDVPELSGRFFLGRQKEGYSLIKVMTGYFPWTIERSPAEDAFVPILADGLKYMGYYSKPRLFLQVGAYADGLSEEEKFSTFDHQFVWRAGWLPILSEEKERVLHVAVMGREGEPDEGKLQVRSRPEANFSPYFVDTGKFDAEYARTIGAEAYYRTGSWLFGTEYNWDNVDDADAGNALFHGGQVSAAWLLTGETRSYNTAGAFFEAISPNKPVTADGIGAWEAVLNLSYIDLDSGRFHGGKLWKATPLLYWHLSDNLRSAFVYGYSELDRFDLKGGTQFYQLRLQFLI